MKSKDKKISEIFSFEENQYLTFFVADEILGLSILAVKEILEFSYVTEVPNMPQFIKGVTNIRGNIVPIIDLGVRIGLDEVVISKKTTIIITEIEDEGERIKVGVLVDAVNKVVEISPSMMEESPSLGTKLKKEYIREMGNIDGKFISILELSTLLNIEELLA